MKIKSFKIFDPEKVLNKLSKRILEFSKNYNTLTDDEISELRAQVSTGTYIFVETNLQPSYEDHIKASIEFEKQKAEAYRRAYNECMKESKSTNLADNRARKLYTSDPEYLKAFEEYQSTKHILYLSGKLLDQSNQVLNSMSRRSNR